MVARLPLAALTAILLLNLCSGSAAHADADWEESSVLVLLSGTHSSAFLTRDYPQNDLRLDFVLSYSAEGVLLDTVGRAEPAPGDWRLQIIRSRLLFEVNAPALGGWQTLRSKTALEPEKEYWVSLVLKDGDGGILVNGVPEVRTSLPQSLSGAPLFAGDFPGDDGMTGLADAALHPAASASMQIVYFGSFVSTVSRQDYARSVIRRELQGAQLDGSAAQILVTTADDFKETVPAGPALDRSGERPKPPTPGLNIARVADAESPADAVRLFLEAQLCGDVPTMLGYTWLEQVSESKQLQAQVILDLIARKLSLKDLYFEPRALALSQQGNLALLSCTHGATLASGSETSSERFASVVLLRKGRQGWKVVEFCPDDLGSLLLTEPSPRSVAVGKGITVGFALPVPVEQLAAVPAPDSLKDGLLDYYALNERFQKTLNGWYFDEGKLWYDAHFSAVGWIPVFGDVVSAAYTGAQTLSTVWNELIPDLRNGDIEMSNIGLQQVACGAFQIAVELSPGADSFADSVGMSLDTYKYNIRQGRNYNRLRSALLYSNLSAFDKYLFLRDKPELHDPRFGLDGRGQTSMRIEYYGGWEGSRRPLRKITFESDIPLRFWKTLEFDLGFMLKIRRSESEALFTAASELGLPVKTVGGPAVRDYEVALPVRLPSIGPSRLVVDGELAPELLALEPEREAAVNTNTSGAQILMNPRLVTGAGSRDRFIRFDIRPTSGPDQSIQIKLLTAQGAQTLPLMVENAVYNDVFAPLLVDQTQLLPFAEQQLTLGLGEQRNLMLLGKTNSYPMPRIIGAPVSIWRIADGSIAAVSESGRFPDAYLRLSGLKVGSTELIYELYTGITPDQEPISGSFEVNVVAGGWRLVDAVVRKIPQVESELFSSTTLEGSAGGAYGSCRLLKTLRGQQLVPACEVFGSVSWTEPPSFIPDMYTQWHCRIGLQLQTSGSPSVPLSGDCLDAARQLLAWSISPQAPDDGGFGQGGGNRYMISAGSSFETSVDIALDAFFTESFSGSAGKPARVSIPVHVSTPGGAVWVDYVYEQTGGSGN